MRRISTPEGLFIYDRTSGLCVFTSEIRSKHWITPLYAQIAVTEKCDMKPPCSWCYLSSSSNRTRVWGLEELIPLIKFLDSYGLFGVAFGGGEPFTHPDIVEIVRQTYDETDLDVSVTTNGFAATPQQIDAMEGHIGEIRVSLHRPESFGNLKKFMNKKFDFGVNLLLMSENTPFIEKSIKKCIKKGINDFLINSFQPVGRGTKHRGLEPKKDDYEALCRVILKFQDRAAFKVSGRLAGFLRRTGKPVRFVPFQDEKRGRIIAITADKKVKPTSLVEESYPFSKPEEIPNIYRGFC